MIEDLNLAVEVLKKGGIILYPSETSWDLGCDATNEEAVNRINQIRMTHDRKTMFVLLDNENRLTQYVEEVPGIAWDLIEVSDKPLTLIYPHAKNLAKNLLSEDKSIGIRITHDEFCNKLIRRFNKPLVSTPANFSGQRNPIIFPDIDQEIMQQVDFVVKWKQNDLSPRYPSPVIKISIKNEIIIIRK